MAADFDGWMFVATALVVTGTWYASDVEPLQGTSAEKSVHNGLRRTKAKAPGGGGVLGDDKRLLHEARESAVDGRTRELAGETFGYGITRSKRVKRTPYMQFAPPTASAEAGNEITDANDIKPVPEPNRTTIPGHDYPELQGKPPRTVLPATREHKHGPTQGARTWLARFPAAGEPQGCVDSDDNHCVNFGGADGFPYATATDDERAAFRAVIARYARKGDSVTIKYKTDSQYQLPKIAGRVRGACEIWHGIEPDVDVGMCEANDDYVKRRIHSQNRAHHQALSDHLHQSWMAAGRSEPRTEVEVPLLHPDFRDALLTSDTDTGDKMTIVVEGRGAIPYLTALEAAYHPSRLSTIDRLVKAVTHQCELIGARDLNFDEIGRSNFLRNYPLDANDPREQYYVREGSASASDEEEEAAELAKAFATESPGGWDGVYLDNASLLPDTTHTGVEDDPDDPDDPDR